MSSITTKQVAEKWNITDQRVRTLCSKCRIPATTRPVKNYHMPTDAKTPTEERINPKDTSHQRWLKWDNTVIATIDKLNNVRFLSPEYNEVVLLYTNGDTTWTSEQLRAFVSERLVNRDRRDIEKILFRCGLSTYDTLRIAEITRAIHPKDMLWIAHAEDEKFNDVITRVFDSIFCRHRDMVSDTIDTPEGYNIKRYGVYNGMYGIYKQRINPLSTDIESEIAVYLLAQKLGVPCCPASRVDKNTIFSAFLYDFEKEYIVHF
ncbi:MAG: hypothetical protein LBE09_07040, partial [Christensenellaceae bacterium]|nr:hypothetical protein [Christensenellaceae bacterium]